MKGQTHLDEVGLGYFAHLRRALRIAGQLLGAGLACLMHGFVPGLFTHTASRTVDGLHRELSQPPAPAPILGAAEAEA
jgi:hypothetical protein